MKIQEVGKNESTKNIDSKDIQLSKQNDKNLKNINLPNFENMLLTSSITSPIGLIITNSEDSIISVNKPLQKLLGFSMEELENMNISKLYVDPNDRTKMLNMISKSKTVRDFEAKLKHKNGTVKFVLANFDHIKLNNMLFLLTSIYDITQYKQRQKNMMVPGKKYRKLFCDVPVGITLADYEDNLIIGNNVILELLGYTSDELKELKIQDFYFEKKQKILVLDLTEKLGSVRDFKVDFKHKNGKRVPVLINIDKINFKDKKSMLLTSIRDIASIKKIEDDLTKEWDFSNTILDITASLIVVLDKKGRVTRFNRICEQISGYTFENIKGTYLGDATFLDPLITKQRIDKLISGDYTKTQNAVWISKNGDKHVISWTDTALSNKNGEVEYIIATGIDITDRQKAEDDLQNANNELALRVKELQKRTYELIQLNEMGRQLQICKTIQEACAISVLYIKKICPTSHGSLCLINEFKNCVEAIEIWGEPSYSKKVFPLQDCSAIMKGEQYYTDGSHSSLRCTHITGPETGKNMCFPLLANGKVIGIINLNYFSVFKENQSEIVNDTYIEHKSQIITTVAEHIALAISNLKLNEILLEQSIRDALTGLFNRRYMELTIEKEIKWVENGSTPFGVIMFDIDHFKDFNDFSGHDGGDALLRELGALLNRVTIGRDIVCRYGGDEFIVVLHDATSEYAWLCAEELRKSVKELSVYHLGKSLPRCTISLGVAIFPENGSTREMLLKSADNALYKAKNSGRDQVIIA